MNAKIIFSGSGGQGIQLASRIFCQACIEEELNVSLMPCYGAEMRGGSTTCNVVISDEEITSPLFDKATHAMLLSGEAFKKFNDKIIDEGILAYENNIQAKPDSNNLKAIKIKASEIAINDVGNTKFLNMVALGAFAKATELIKLKSLEIAIENIIGKKNKETCQANIEALKLGFNKGIAN